MTRSAPVLLLSLLLAGCGFHLRGQLDLPRPLEAAYISGVPRSSPLAQEVAFIVTGAGGRVVDDPAAASGRLAILGEDYDRRVLSVDSSGKVSEYELRYAIRYALHGPDGAVIVPEQSVSGTRSYRFDPVNVLGTGEEEAVLREELRRQTVTQMLRRLRIMAPSGQSAPPAAP
jgi:LPS-assembly lipoprotein